VHDLIVRFISSIFKSCLFWSFLNILIGKSRFYPRFLSPIFIWEMTFLNVSFLISISSTNWIWSTKESSNYAIWVAFVEHLVEFLFHVPWGFVWVHLVLHMFKILMYREFWVLVWTHINWNIIRYFFNAIN